jgi:signal transduction histidine kinase
MFYEKDGFLVDEVCNFIGAGLRAGDTCILIASTPHRMALEEGLRLRGHAVGGNPPFPGQLLLLDARETLTRFMLDGRPDPARFAAVLGGVIEQASRCPSGRVRAFGEMVALLWEDGNREAAIELEALWNQLAESHEFSLFCAYPLHAFSETDDAASFRHVCDAHTHVHAACTAQEDGPAREDRLNRDIAELRQKAKALETEVARRRQLEQELEQKLGQLADMDRRKDEFIAMLGHELRNPLAPITTSLCLMRLQSGDLTAVTSAREVIERQVALITRLVNDLLDVSRIAHGKIELRKEIVRLDAIVEQALELNRPLISRLGHRVTLDLPDQAELLHGDPARLGQALANLIDNAARYTDAGGEIRLSATVEAGRLLLSVRDNGTNACSTCSRRAATRRCMRAADWELA